ncbi:sensor domain-containing diguanylate cyclase [Pseudomonas sp. GOM6]|uniref:GGDEF domain-containing protein n=1 Tax=Pseudomonas sp. GOM6 TaxID=3036944 RepID=UPI0024096E15|nr:sensor domain-containing diguanylate cyclase [Pseudomonas sp. GOM6]MDG1582394.1 diguanylate cyclase [Pseudomonas sp. GOM6]
MESITTRQAWSSDLKIAGLVCLLVLTACLLGIATRPLGHLATIWPANALLLGLLVRYPQLARPAGWLGGIAAYVIADSITGGAPLQTLMLTLANMAGVVSAYLLLSRLSAEHRRLSSPLSVPYLALAVTLASLASGLVGAVIDPLLFDGTPFSGLTFWFVTELVNYIAILPVLLTMPDWPERLKDRRQTLLTPRQRLLHALPAVSLVIFGVLCLMVGGPGALAFPVPALLWCALSYSVFTTALLTFAFTSTLLVVLAVVGIPLAPFDMNSHPVLLSLRLGITLLAFAPLTVASVMAVRNQLLQRMQYMASHDQLSGLLNRWAFYEQAKQLSPNRPLALLMFDIDHFKRINDTHGHAAGDLVLKAFARRASRGLRDGDALARLGGEEFALLLPGCSHNQVQAIAERIRTDYANASISLEDGQHVHSTVSIGAVVALQPPADIDELLLSADRALYQAKESGRNRVVIHQYASDEQARTETA